MQVIPAQKVMIDTRTANETQNPALAQDPALAEDTIPPLELIADPTITPVPSSMLVRIPA